MTKFEDNQSPYITFLESTAPGTPASGLGKVYVKSSDSNLYFKNDGGTESQLSGGAAGAPTNADYLVGTANGSLSAEIVVGTSPGGELGGTWASPTVDATHSGTSHVGIMPWTITVNPLAGSYANTNWDSIVAATGEEFVLASSGAQNDEVTWQVVLAAGTWSVFLTFHRFTSRGIATVYFDAGSVGTIDMYGTDAPCTRGAITSISVAATGVVAMKLKMATKNASSSSYGAWLSGVQLIRTA